MTTIKHKQSANAGVVPVVSNDATNELELGEIAINTHDGKMFIKRDTNGNLGLVEVGKRDVANNVLYVSKSGNDSNDGKTVGDAFATIESALAAANQMPPGVTIFVKSGTYEINNASDTENGNPMGGLVVPKFCSIVGDNLRATRVEGSSADNDLFYVQNGSYITNITFQGMQQVSQSKRQPAAVSFPPIALQANQQPQEITTSPYVENCTAFNTTATGMLIDGSLTTGLRSMVSDSYTQINAGGTGVHIINRGYAQLVSIFTVSCDHAILCESGGQCSLTNSNASFGNFGLKATGSSESLYAGALTSDSVAFANTLQMSTSVPPKYGDAFLVNDVDLQLLAKCARDVDIILDAVGKDLVGNTNFNSVYAGIAYQRKNALTDSNMVADTANALLETKRLVGLLPEISTDPGIKLLTDSSFDVITNIITNGTTIDVNSVATYPGDGVAPALNLNPVGRSTTWINAEELLENNKEFLVQEVIGYIATNHNSLVYNQEKCKRDVRYIVDALRYDLLYGGNSATLDVAKSYFIGASSQLGSEEQKTATIGAYGYLADIVELVIRKITVSPVLGTGTQSFTGTTDGGTQYVAADAHDLVEVIKQMISDDDLEALPALESETAIATTGNVVDARDDIAANKRDIKKATTDWVTINTGIDDNFFYTVENVQASIDFTGFDHNNQSIQLTTATIPSSILAANNQINNLNRINADGSPDTAGHGLKLGQPVKYVVSEGGTPIAGDLEPGQIYFAVPVSNTSIKLSTTDNGSNIVSITNNTGDGIHQFIPKFFYNQSKCIRDVGLILDAVADDVALGTNFNAVYTGLSYQRYSAYQTVTGPGTNQKAPTLAAMLEAKRQVSQLANVDISHTARVRANAAFDEIIHIFEDGAVSNTQPGDAGGVADALFLPNTLGATTTVVAEKDALLANTVGLQDEHISYLTNNYGSLIYDEQKCRRDVRYIIDALAYDILYDTNTATLRAANSYYILDDDGQSVAQLPSTQKAATIAAYGHFKSELSNTITDSTVLATAQGLVQTIIDHIDVYDVSALPAPVALDFTGVTGIDDKVAARTEILANKTSIQNTTGGGVDIYRVQPLEDVRDAFTGGFTVDFRKRSLIAASSMTFEYVGTGTQIRDLTGGDLYNRPRTDDFPKTENEVIFDETTNLGAVYFTSTDHKGDFRIGSEMRINRTAGRIEGDTFNRSLFSVITPYILAIEGN